MLTQVQIKLFGNVGKITVIGRDCPWLLEDTEAGR